MTRSCIKGVREREGPFGTNSGSPTPSQPASRECGGKFTPPPRIRRRASLVNVRAPPQTPPLVSHSACAVFPLAAGHSLLPRCSFAALQADPSSPIHLHCSALAVPEPPIQSTGVHHRHSSRTAAAVVRQLQSENVSLRR